VSVTTWQAQEELLAAALRVISGRIDDRPQGPNDDAEAEYAEDCLLLAAQNLARAKLAERLERAADQEGPKPSLERRILLRAEQIADDATAGAGGDHPIKVMAGEAAVMELALVELAEKLDGVTLDPAEGREIALCALPEGAGKP
jgi:hypothetical protein